VPADLNLVRRVTSAADNLAVVATTRPDGTVHTSVVNAGLVDDPVSNQPAVGFVVGGDAVKLTHLRRSGRAAAVFRQGWQWASIEGPVRLVGPDDPSGEVDPAEIPALLRSVFSALGGTHEDWAEYDRVMAEERRTAVFIHPDRITGVG
jgi:PPOX class probable F420-dependent enzyme